MSFDWGAAAGGAQQGLEDLIARQILEEKMALAQRQQAAEEQHRAAVLAESRAGREQQGGQFDRSQGFTERKWGDEAPQRTATLDNTVAATEDTKAGTAGKLFKATRDKLGAEREDAARPQVMQNPLFRASLIANDAGVQTSPVDTQIDTKHKNRMGEIGAEASASAASQARYTALKDGVDANGKAVTLGMTRGGTWEVVPNPDGASVRSVAGKVTGVQDSAARFFARGHEALKDMESVEPRISSLIQQAGGLTPNVMQSKEWQLYDNALRRYTESRLRKDSGAAVPPSEYENDRKMFGITFGDKPETIDKKRSARRSTIGPLAYESRGALDNYFGEDEAQKLRDTYRPGASQENSGGTAIGTERVVNGVPAVWDGKGWKAK